MEKITSLDDLKKSILLLEIKQQHEKLLMKDQFRRTIESIKPGNLIKNKFNDIVKSPNLKENLLDAAISLGMGYLSKKAIIGTTHNPLRKLFGTLLQVGVTGIVSKNTEGIKSAATHLINTFLNKKNKSN